MINELEKHTQDAGHLTEVNAPPEVVNLEGFETPHPERETVEHAEQLQDQGAKAQGAAALLTPIQGKVVQSQDEKQKGGILSSLSSLFGKNNEGKRWSEEVKERDRKEFRHAA